ncbi:MAG: FAD-binding oxidoreductase [Alphaproteobacteria bacterium]
MEPQDAPSSITDRLPRDVEIAVVGAGVAGLSAGLFLSRAGREVAIIDRATPWGDASGANAGTLSLQVKRLEVLELARFSIKLWGKFKPDFGIDVGFMQPGGLRIAANAAEVKHLREYTEEQARSGFHLEWLEGNAVRALAPWLGPSVLAATYCEEDAFASALLTGSGLLGAAARAGVRVVGQCPVRAIARENGAYVLDTGKGSLRAKILVIAAGPWSAGIARMLDVVYPSYVDVNMLSVTEPTPFFLDRVITHIGGILSLKQFANGTVLIGGGWQGRGTFGQMEKYTDNLRLKQNFAVAAEIVPALRRLRVVRSWAGYEAVAPDALPVLGRLPGRPDAYIAAGARGGFTLGPAQGFLITELIVNKGQTSIPIDRYDPARLVQGVRA